jgi:GH15 family glucan-1,4-alpha-glucosidase
VPEPTTPTFPQHVLREYALLADGERGIVVGPRGDYVWMCLPRWDSEAVFSTLMGGPGVYAVTPESSGYVWGGHYEDGSLIWRSRWVTNDGIVECREALALPADEHRAVALRRIQAIDGPAKMRVVLDARAGFGKNKMTRLSKDDGIWTAHSGPARLRWTGAPDAVHTQGALVTHLELEEGQTHDLVLEIADGPIEGDRPRPEVLWSETEEAWRVRVPEVATDVATRDARQAVAVLGGLTSTGGGMVAAATTSLPERAEAGRNYDYRYSWIRDQCYAGQAAAVAGVTDLLDGAVGFVSERLLEDGPNLKPAYTVGGQRIPDQTELDLPGYPGSEVRIGNQVMRQFQLDAFGEALLMMAAAARMDRLDSQQWRAAEAAVAAIEKRRGEPEAGIWELYDDVWSQSRLICAAGLRQMAQVAPSKQGGQWNALADSLVSQVSQDSLHDSGRWQRSPTDARVDASLLMAAVRNAVPADDPRSLATLDAVRSDLGSDLYVYRFRQDERPLNEAEGAFLLCGFQMALGLHQQGQDAEAFRWFERNRAATGSPGLLTEEFDVVQRQLRGNLPQAFVHAMLLETACRLANPWPTTS